MNICSTKAFSKQAHLGNAYMKIDVQQAAKDHPASSIQKRIPTYVDILLYPNS